jgi:hypothetical protein
MNPDNCPHRQKGKAGYLDRIACLASPWVYVDYTRNQLIIKINTQTVTFSLPSKGDRITEQ